MLGLSMTIVILAELLPLYEAVIGRKFRRTTSLTRKAHRLSVPSAAPAAGASEAGGRLELSSDQDLCH